MYNTPGVYVEEIPKFPPSIAPVETAIPAFVGYTEKALLNGESLVNKPTRIESIAEYEFMFGGGPSQDVTITLDTNNRFIRADSRAKLYLYDSLRLFYANGGGNCYILSVGKYPADVKSADLEAALDVLEQEDEPTIILAPDVVSDAGGPYEFQKKALNQCNKLKDRVTLCDLTRATTVADFKISVNAFRDTIGINNLKYGAAYGPWIQANLPRQIWQKNLILRRDGTGDAILLESLTTDTGVLNLIRDVKAAEKSSADLTANVTAITGADDKTLTDSLQKSLDAYRLIDDASTAPQTVTALQGFTDLTTAILKTVQQLNAMPAVPGTKFTISDSIDAYLSNSALKNAIASLAAHATLQGANNTAKNAAKTAADKAKTDAETANTEAVAAKAAADAAPGDAEKAAEAKAKADAKVAADAAQADAESYLAAITISAADPLAKVVQTGADLDVVATLLGYADGAALLADPAQKAAVASLYPATVDTRKKRADLVRSAAYRAATESILLMLSVQSSLYDFEKTLNDALLASFGTFKELVTKGAEALNLLPPSGAIAGVYAATDLDRGVWKAPANVSLNAVTGPGVKISQEQQGEYNVDVNAGKSINIIRAFPGRGTLVWGARTLAGNDNEWRYVPVRRFFNFVEESVKKATEQFVFEPNDANTWVKVQAMNENFLTTLWRQGALQGIKPEHAFYVAVGLGKTMTPLDILEGRMIIEIGMAAVRPAEFIILKFSHKMAES